MPGNDHFRTGPQLQPKLRAALDPNAGFRLGPLGRINPLASWLGGTAPAALKTQRVDSDPRLTAVIIMHAAEGLGEVMLAADAALGREVSFEEIRAASKGIPMSEFKANFKLTATAGRII